MKDRLDEWAEWYVRRGWAVELTPANGGKWKYLKATIGLARTEVIDCIRIPADKKHLNRLISRWWKIIETRVLY